MPVIDKNGNIFNSDCQTLVNTVNCDGVMGKGIALVYQCRYPELFIKYQEFCKKKLLTIGKLYLYKPQDESEPWVLNFPTKDHWNNPSKMKYIELGLKKFCETYEKKGIKSIAFPMLGTNNGELDHDEVKALMQDYLSRCNNIKIEIWEYDQSAHDDLFINFKKIWLEKSNAIDQITREHNITIHKKQIQTITNALEQGNTYSMIDLIKQKSIGIVTMQKAYKIAKLIKTENAISYEQLSMFN